MIEEDYRKTITSELLDFYRKHDIPVDEGMTCEDAMRILINVRHNWLPCAKRRVHVSKELRAKLEEDVSGKLGGLLENFKEGNHLSADLNRMINTDFDRRQPEDALYENLLDLWGVRRMRMTTEAGENRHLLFLSDEKNVYLIDVMEMLTRDAEGATEFIWIIFRNDWQGFSQAHLLSKKPKSDFIVYYPKQVEKSWKWLRNPTSYYFDYAFYRLPLSRTMIKEEYLGDNLAEGLHREISALCESGWEMKRAWVLTRDDSLGLQVQLARRGRRCVVRVI